ncbi:hypothetical protein D3C81_2032010 [compost metagenome]
MQTGSEQPAQHNDDDHVREGQEAVGNTHEDAVQPSAAVTGYHACRGADQQCGGESKQAVSDGLLSAEHQPGQHITAQMVRSQRVFKAWPLQADAQIRQRRVMPQNKSCIEIYKKQ